MVAVGVSVGVSVAVGKVPVEVGVSVDVAEGVFVGVSVPVFVGVPVGVSVTVSVEELVGVSVTLKVMVWVGVSVGVSTWEKAGESPQHAPRKKKKAIPRLDGLGFSSSFKYCVSLVISLLSIKQHGFGTVFNECWNFFIRGVSPGRDKDFVEAF